MSIILNWKNTTSFVTKISIYRQTIDPLNPSEPGHRGDHVVDLPGNSERFEDPAVVAGETYRYAIESHVGPFAATSFSRDVLATEELMFNLKDPVFGNEDCQYYGTVPIDSVPNVFEFVGFDVPMPHWVAKGAYHVFRKRDRWFVVPNMPATSTRNNKPVYLSGTQVLLDKGVSSGATWNIDVKPDGVFADFLKTNIADIGTLQGHVRAPKGATNEWTGVIEEYTFLPRGNEVEMFIAPMLRNASIDRLFPSMVPLIEAPYGSMILAESRFRSGAMAIKKMKPINNNSAFESGFNDTLDGQWYDDQNSPQGSDLILEGLPSDRFPMFWPIVEIIGGKE